MQAARAVKASDTSDAVLSQLDWSGLSATGAQACFTTALLRLYYGFTTTLLRLYHFTTLLPANPAAASLSGNGRSVLVTGRAALLY
jgi:hypothetical protein